MEQLAQLVADNGGEMEFPAFVAAARANGLRPENWLRAKHKGLIETAITADGRHVVRVPQPTPAGGE